MSDWWGQAMCVGHGDEMFPADGDDDGIDHAKMVCAQCGVRGECLSYAVSHNEKHGVWGGMDEHERRKFRRKLVSSGQEIPVRTPAVRVTLFATS